MDTPAPPLDHSMTDPPDRRHEPPSEDLIEDEMVVEEISIDGMCGVY